MKKILNMTALTTRKLMLVFLLFSPGLTADVYFEEMGKLSSISSTHIVAGDLQYKLLPTVKVFLENRRAGSINQLERGDDLRLKIMVINNKPMVDTIYQLADSNEEQESNTERE